MACLANEGCQKYNNGRCMSLCGLPEAQFVKAVVQKRREERTVIPTSFRREVNMPS